jgi:aspartyl-tRNA(Asn)/glutamyl-tRNA(Gln) amidotransferase subunit B
MEEGSLRCDINVSVRRVGEPLGTRCEIKNVNSIRFVQQAIEYEANRQVELLEEGGTVDQETRLFDSRQGITRSMRSKEFAHDYRYFPDPDLLPLELDQAWIDEIAADLPELPDEKKQRFQSSYGLPAYDAGVLVADQDTATFFEAVAKGRDAKTAANWVMGDFFAALNRSGLDLSDSPVGAEKLGGLIDLISDGTISGRIAKEVFEEMWESGKDASAIVEDKGLKQISDTGELEAIIGDLIAKSPEQVQQVKDGNQKVIGWFVGQVMKATQGKANPGVVNQILRQKLGI